jgi:DNA-binding NarL/FixJ family response regulator
MEKIRIRIADDHPLFRDGMHGLLDSVPNIEVIGEATTGEEVITLAATLKPDVILMDIRMPGMNGIQATRQIPEVNPEVNILMVTMLEDDESVFAAMRVGARGYILKGANQAEVLRAIHSVANGEAIFGPGVAQQLLNFFHTPARQAPKAFPELTDREVEILTLIAQGWTNEEIADHFVLSLKTVRNHASNIFGKLQVTDRAQAALRARQAGLGNG